MMKFLIPTLFMTLLVGCSSANFRGKSPKRSKAPTQKKDDPKVDPNTNPNTNPNSNRSTNPVDTPLCEDTQFTIGANLALIIDNSASNNDTDCPDRRLVGNFRGTEVYECRGETNREKAVLTVFDTMQNISQTARDASAQSRMAIASFPTRNDYSGGWSSSQVWYGTANILQRAFVAGAMKFSRKPFGNTPYKAAMEAARELFNRSPNNDNNHVMILITDGEPTDRDPKEVLQIANDLKSSGIQLITVFVTGNKTRGQRLATHREMLEEFDNGHLANFGTPWYDENQYNDFSDYLSYINGSSNRKPLSEALTTDSNRFYEASDSSRLSEVLANVVRKEVIKCK